MCLEPFGATGLFILGRGARLLAAGVVTEKEEEEEEKRGGMGNRDRQRGAARRARAAAPGAGPASLLPQKPEKELGQARREKRRQIKVGSARFPDSRLPNSSSKDSGNVKVKAKQNTHTHFTRVILSQLFPKPIKAPYCSQEKAPNTIAGHGKLVRRDGDVSPPRTFQTRPASPNSSRLCCSLCLEDASLLPCLPQPSYLSRPRTLPPTAKPSPVAANRHLTLRTLVTAALIT